MVRLSGDIRLGKTHNPILANYWLAKQMWKELGLTVWDVERLPWQMVEDITTIMQLEIKDEDAKIKKAQSKNKSSPSPSGR